ncbi:hypothetical protein L5G28_07475 [Gordonia sp. HY285]|uniref:hypothetical protein n=1 Tax=Gordonia liuliyuniae TaxID=2911517 RepID=UPI001F1B4B5A|nr:hypothetical protein [Gordonia liuliyuniae]MCF8610000.1 hypothetical protein [Gordonia liuliyuniae]
MTNNLIAARLRIAAAREEYLADHPLDPHEKALMGHDLDGMPAGFITVPDFGHMQIVAAKLGTEYLAICHDEDSVEEWITLVLKLAQSPELAGIMFANVFRGMDLLIGSIIERAGLTNAMAGIAVEGWGKDFSDFEDES